MKNSLSFKKILLKKMLFNYGEYSALLMYFALYQHKIFLFVQKSQVILQKLLKLLIGLSFSLSYFVINTSFLKLLFKFVGCLHFLFRELILIFFDSDLLIQNLLSYDIFSKNIVFLSYNSFFLNIKFLPAIGKFTTLFAQNFSSFKANTYSAIYSVAYYSTLIINQTII